MEEIQMKLNETIYAKTHAEFLNKVFGTQYKAWMKSVWSYNSNYIVWMVCFDGKIRDGWKNTFIGWDEIKEENNDYNKKYYDGQPLPYYTYQKRIVIEIDNTSFARKYIFRGVYQYDKEKSNPYQVRYYNKIADEF